MNNFINTTDLHIQYKLETGKHFQFLAKGQSRSFHPTENYNREYAKWIEEKYLELLNKTKTNK